MSDEQPWYYAVGGETRGPFTETQLRSMAADGSVGPETLIWSEELGQWRPLSQTRLSPGPAGGMVATPSYRTPSSADGPASWAGPRPTGFVECVKAFFAKYATFSGRAGRPEYWWPVVFSM
ncbi:MAG: GYF domain-containing protein, partial [Hansschlegelia sp.]